MARRVVGVVHTRSQRARRPSPRRRAGVRVYTRPSPSLSPSHLARDHTHTHRVGGLLVIERLSVRPHNAREVRTWRLRTRREVVLGPSVHLILCQGKVDTGAYMHTPSLPPSLTRTEKTKTKNEDKKRTHQDRACAFALALALVRARALRLLALSRCRALSPSPSLALALALSPRIVSRTLQAPVSLARSPLRSRAPVRSLAHPRPVPEPPPPGAREPTSRAM